MNTIQTLRASRSRMAVLAVLLLGLMGWGNPLMAVTFKINATTNGYFYYKIDDGNEQGPFNTNKSFSVASGKKVTLHAAPKGGYKFKEWSWGSSTNSSYVRTWTVGSDNITVSATFEASQTGDSWEGALNSRTYILTSTSDGGFKVTNSDGTGAYHNKTYKDIGNLYIDHGYTTTIVFNTTKPVMMSGTIRVYNGDLTMSLGDDYNDSHPTLKRKEGNDSHLILAWACNAVYTNHKITINGNESNQFIVHGGCDGMAIDSTDMANRFFTKTESDLTSIYPIIKFEGGDIHMNYVTVTNAWDRNAEIAGIFWGDHSRLCEVHGEMNHCLIQWCRGVKYGSALKCDNYVRGSKVTMSDCEVRYCETTTEGDLVEGGGGAIRSSGNNLCQLEMLDCNVHHNYTDDRGGGLRWNAVLIYPSLTVKRCNFYNNWAGNNGGGMRVEGLADIESCTFRNNRAEVAGGGISMGTFNVGGQLHLDVGGGEWLPKNANLTLDENTVIEDNEAGEYGGGIYINGKFITTNSNTGSPFLTFLNDSLTPYKLIFEMNGTTIRNNTAGVDGGAVYMVRETDYYQQIVNLNHGIIENNTALQNGGSFCITENLVAEYTYPNMGTTWTRPKTGVTYSLSKQPIHANIGKEGASEELTMTNNTARNGGAIYVNGGSVTVHDNAVVGQEENANVCTGGNGGAVHVTGGNLVMKGGSVAYNQAQVSSGQGGHGGGFYVTGGLISVEGGSIGYNTADVAGGGFYVNAPSTSDTTFIKGGAIVSNNTAVCGGGAYINKGQLRIKDSATSVNFNKATTSGGGIYMVSGTVLFNDATMHADSAQYGGGFYLGNGDVIIDGATISNNVSTVGHGGAFDIANGDLTVSNTSITSNKAPNGNGGGAYVGNGDIVFNAGTTVTNNTAINGGGLYLGGGSITYNNGDISHNTATGNGGGIYANADVEFNGGTVSENTARNGGGLYASAGTVDFSSGTFSQNYASGNGGGIYVKQGAIVQLSGNAVITKNHVPFAVDEEVGHGGGVYLAGQMKVGRNPGDPQGTHSLQVQDNYENVATRLNNVFLPTNENVIELLSDIRNSTGTKIGFSVNNGFRKVVYHNNDGSTTSSSWLHDLLGGTQGLTGVIFDDSQKYMAIHVLSSNETFDHNYIYLWGCWISAVDKDPNDHTDEYPLPTGTEHHYTIADDGTWHIYTKEGLAWFSSYVNGLNEFQTTYNEDVNAAAKAVMEADVDMSEFLWVPLGSAKSFTSASTSPTGSIFEDGHLFKGSFDGRGHVISGLDCRYINSIHNYGLFGKLVGEANVCNTFVDNYLYSSNEETNASGVYFMGGIAGMASGNSIISNCEARGRQSSPLSTVSVLGGIVGNLQDNATVHSSIGLPELAGVATNKGGIAGQTAAGTSIRNSYSNPKIGTVSGNVGGLVGTNAGTVENCYVRLQHATAPTNFYWFAAVNNGTVGCCYARNDASSDRYTTVTAATGSGTYGLTQLPYLYKHRDTQVAAANDYVPTGTDADKQMMIVLNNWVEAPAQASGNYTKWGRPWQESDAQKPLNDDYPILKMPVAEAVAAEAGDPYLYYGTVDNLLTQYDAAGDAIWVYRNPSDTVRGDNSASAAKLYIAEDVALLNDNALKAYVGITLDNSAGTNGAHPTYGSVVGVETDATDWHMIATPLSDAPTGINYTDGDAYDFAWGHPDGMPYYRFYPKDDAKHGYFPSHRFGKSYPISDAMIEEGNYYQEWDFYSYSEPDYHWINFKRNSASHHHMEAEDHYSIAYDNETRLVPGKGYFAATREETFLQCQGHLNNGAVAYNLTQTSGVPRHGYNLIGNPYQAYLNFDDFADANSGTGDNKIWADASNASYTILDEDELETSINVETVMGQKPVFYRTYSYGCSSNPGVSAGGFIHPHQGFFVRLEGKAAASAYFYPDQRNASDTVGSNFRGVEHIDYPLVNLFAIEEDGAADVVTVELGRPDQGGAALMQGLRVGNGKIWCHYNDKDYAIAYTQPGITEVGIRFETVEDTEYTMRWSTRNGEFSYLHLIDNKTGADVDCLATDEYRFSASTSDYKSRFRLVFGYTGIEEDSEAEANENFAFIMNDALVVTGEGVLQVFDMTGRMVASQELHGVQTTVSLPNAANGVYVLRLTNGRQSQVQKMVISK